VGQARETTLIFDALPRGGDRRSVGRNPRRSAVTVVVRHQPKNLTREKYDEVSSQMEGTGAWPPDGLDMHVCFGTEGSLLVSEIWDSEEKFRSFTDRLYPALQKAGVDYEEPQVYEAHEYQKRPEGATA
jgi:hypothetical protein